MIGRTPLAFIAFARPLLTGTAPSSTTSFFTPLITSASHLTTNTRLFASSTDEKSQSMLKIIIKELNTPKVVVEDISGGCGSMYNVEVTSEIFKGVPKVKQHRMVLDVIKKEIGEMHGLTVKTYVPKVKA